MNNDSHNPVWTLSFTGWKTCMTKWLNTGNEHDTFHILRRLLLGGKQPTKKSWVGVGREASPPWLHATQLLPPGFVFSSVLHFSHTVPHLTDANRRDNMLLKRWLCVMFISLLLGHWYEIMALYYVKSILTEISASRQERRVLQKSKIIRIEFLSKWGMLQTSRYV